MLPSPIALVARGETITADQYNKLANALNALAAHVRGETLCPGPGYLKQQSTNGYTLQLLKTTATTVPGTNGGDAPPPEIYD